MRWSTVSFSRSRTSRLLRTLVAGTALGFTVLTGACDSGPSGPGNFDGTLEAEGTPLGGVVLEVMGKGITSFSGAGGTRVLWAATDVLDTYRVVAINQSPGDVIFKVAVEDVGGDKPTATVVTLIDGNNTALNITSSHRVAFTHEG